MAARVRDGNLGGDRGRTAGVEEASGEMAAPAEGLIGPINKLRLLLRRRMGHSSANIRRKRHAPPIRRGQAPHIPQAA
jgi:hypothetical protein